MTITVAVLVPPIQSNRPPPMTLPIVKALTSLPQINFNTVFGFDVFVKNNTVRINGLELKNKEWIESNSSIDIIHDRFPSQIRSNHFKSLYHLTKELPWGNPFETTMLCRDKLLCQRLLEQTSCYIPEVISDFDTFQSHLTNWGTGFIKPRYGALGIGVSHVTADSNLPQFLPGVVPNQQDPSILQRAIKPPHGYAGMSVRQLMQKDESGYWFPRTAVLRHSSTDPVVNVARGALASPAHNILPIDTITSIQSQSLFACQILDQQPNGETNVEFGLDFVIDTHFQPWLIEVNSRPRGRLEYLAEQFPDRYRLEHEHACIQPILTLATIAENRKGHSR